MLNVFGQLIAILESDLNDGFIRPQRGVGLCINPVSETDNKIVYYDLIRVLCRSGFTVQKADCTAMKYRKLALKAILWGSFGCELDDQRMDLQQNAFNGINALIIRP